VELAIILLVMIGLIAFDTPWGRWRGWLRWAIPGLALLISALMIAGYFYR
jgi:hypothetical protein